MKKFKIVLKEWAKDPKACALLVIWFILLTGYTAVSNYVPVSVANVLDNLDNWKSLIWIVAAATGAQIILDAICAYIRPYAVHHCFTRMNNDYGDMVANNDYEWFTKHSVATINTCAEFIWHCVGAGVEGVRMIGNIISMLITAVTMWYVGGPLVLPVLAVYVIGAIVMSRLYKVYDRIDSDSDKIKKRRNQLMENMINGFQEVRAFSHQERDMDAIHSMNDEIFSGRKKRGKINVLLHGSIELIDALGVILVLCYSVWKIGEGTLTIAEASVLVGLVLRIMQPLGSILDFFDDISQRLGLAEQFADLVSYKNKIQEKKDTMNLSSFDHEIQINNVGFAYGETKKAISNITMSIKKGQKIGIVSGSGEGKSTLFKLLNKFYQPQEGEITIDGVNIWDVSNKSYRKLIGCVFQDNTIFPGTIRENILYGSENAMEWELIQACKKAHILNFIMGLEDKFDTDVGPRGLTLSGGQKQRIALARLFLKNPQVILLDEATASLDNESEALVQRAIEKMQNKTTITIAHRLKTLENCDKIYVMSSHGVLESGTHKELLEAEGEYYRLYHAGELVEEYDDDDDIY